MGCVRTGRNAVEKQARSPAAKKVARYRKPNGTSTVPLAGVAKWMRDREFFRNTATWRRTANDGAGYYAHNPPNSAGLDTASIQRR